MFNFLSNKSFTYFWESFPVIVLPKSMSMHEQVALMLNEMPIRLKQENVFLLHPASHKSVELIASIKLSFLFLENMIWDKSNRISGFREVVIFLLFDNVFVVLFGGY